MTSGPRDSDEAVTPSATHAHEATSDPQSEVTSEAPLPAVASSVTGEAPASRAVLTKPRVIGGPPTEPKAHVRGQGLVKVERRPSSESVAPPTRPTPVHSGLTPVSRPAPAPAPRALIRPALRGRDEGPAGIDTRSQAPRSLDRPIVHPQSRALLASVQRDIEAADAPLAAAREEAVRAPTRPSAPSMPSVSDEVPLADVAPVPEPGPEPAEPLSYDVTQRGFTRQQLSEHARVSSKHAAGIEPVVPEERPAVVWPAPSAPPARVATAPMFSRSAEIPIESVERSPSSPRAIQQARATVPFEAKYEAPPGRVAPPPSLQERALVAPGRLSQRDDLRAREIRSRAADDIATVTETTRRPSASQILPKLSIITMVLLFQAVALPTAAGAPWELLARPAEVTLQALAAFILVAVVHLLPCRERTRGMFGVVLGLLLLPFAFVAWRAAVTSGVFDAQPALVALVTGPLPTPALAAHLALVLVPAGMFARGSGAPRVAAWILAGAGIAATVVALAMLPVGAFFASLSGANFLGDRVAAWATLPLFVVMLLVPIALAVPRLARAANVVGFLVWGAALVPLVALALFAAKSDQWMLVLEPIKLVTFLAAVTLYTSAAVATASDSARRE